MLATITDLKDKVKKDTKTGVEHVNALFYWDGQKRCVPVRADRNHKVGDLIEVHLIEVYSREKQQGWKWWECVED